MIKFASVTNHTAQNRYDSLLWPIIWLRQSWFTGKNSGDWGKPQTLHQEGDMEHNFHRPGARFVFTEMCAYKTEDLKMNVCLHRLVDVLNKEKNGGETTIRISNFLSPRHRFYWGRFYWGFTCSREGSPDFPVGGLDTLCHNSPKQA